MRGVCDGRGCVMGGGLYQGLNAGPVKLGTSKGSPVWSQSQKKNQTNLSLSNYSLQDRA